MKERIGMSIKENRPYVVSADSSGLLKSWARENWLTVPNDVYFQGMLRDLEKTLQKSFKSVEIIPEDFLRRGLNELIIRSPFPVVSLDRAYINPKQRNLLGFIDVTRTVDRNLNNTGLQGRTLELSLERQINILAAKQAGRVISIVDDVIFEGQTMLQLVEKLRLKGVVVDSIYAGIAIQEGKTYRLIDSKSEKVGFYFVSGVRVWATDHDSKEISFFITKIA